MRDYIQQLRQRGDLRTVSREVDPAFELAAVAWHLQRESDAAILFKKVRGTNFPVISNVYGSYRRLCEMIGTVRGGFCRRWHELTQGGAGQAPASVSKVAAPADLQEGRMSDLPQVRYFERDAGPYITAGIFLAREPETGIPNLSFCRSLMVSDREVRARLAPVHDLAWYQA
ncbi:MAG: UbiD family decarboxylase, partial [Gammaproteobacteria bacterium]